MSRGRPSPGEPPLLRLLVRLYPPAVRRRHGDAMLAFYAERFAEARRLGESPIRVWRRTLVDLVTTAGTEWLQLRRPAAVEGAPPAGTTPTHSLASEDGMRALGKEAVYAVRGLRKNGAFAAAAVITLALGIGSTTAIFSVVESVLLRPLPFPQTERLVVPESRDRATGERWSVTYADFMDWRDHRVFDEVAVYQHAEMDLAGPAEPLRVSAAAVSPRFFEALAIPPAAGRPK